MDTLVTIEPERKPALTQFVVIGPDGTPTLEAGYWEAPRRHESLGGESAPYTDPKKVAAKAQGLTGVLADELAMARRDVLALHVAGDLPIALNLAIFTLADKAMGKYGDTGSSLVVNRRSDPIAKNGLPDSPSGNALAAIRNALDTDWANHVTVSERFDAFCALDDEMRAGWLAVCVASSIEASLGGSGIGRHNAFHDHLGQLLEIDTAAWWRPTAGGYFARVRKAGMQRTLTDVGGPTLAGRYASAKSAEMAEACEKVCSGNIIANEEVRQAGLSWLPTAMRFDAGNTVEPDAPIDDLEREGSNVDEEPGPPAVSSIVDRYQALRDEVPGSLLLCRMGDFFELFDEDAVTAARVLDIALTTRTLDGDAVQMVGVPVHSVETYIAALVEAGFSIAVADHLGTETPAIVRVIILPEAAVDQDEPVDAEAAALTA